jgi:23S rRNA pseudouridine2605 synthase
MERKKDNYKGNRKLKGKASTSLLKGAEMESSALRLNKFIANSGLCSRRQADELIAQGKVMVNNEIVTEMGHMVAAGSNVKVGGKTIKPKSLIYVLLNKPKGYITTKSDPQDRKTVMDLIKMPGADLLYPVGRLDRNTSGVLLLTNDGEFAQCMTHPSFEIKKIYRAKLDRRPSKEHLLQWIEGVTLEDGIMSFEQIGFVQDEDDTVVGIEVHSGKNRIVRRMFEHFEYEVKALDRVMMGEFDHLKVGRGKWRLLNDKEVRYVDTIKRKFAKKAATKK